ncbi:MAG: ATP-binding protein [Treponemataceae bacterium]|nr:ATP-binding protein [Treponemataceae bacterium]
MEEIEFQVSAKTARLIGRENISDASSALLELIKNGYDADADCCFIRIIMPFFSIPREVTFNEREMFFKNFDFEKYYETINGKYLLRENLPSEDIDLISDLLLSQSKIVIADNGTGMSHDILSTVWMNIGTNDKEINYKSSKKGRIKTGAKGIGRFALDKLSTATKVISKTRNNDTWEWKINWAQFDKADMLKQVKAVLNKTQLDFLSKVYDTFGEAIKDYDWESGTLIELNPLREFLSKGQLSAIQKSLNNINPYNSIDKFNVVLRNDYFPIFDFVTSEEEITPNTYDYHIEANIENKKIHLELTRNEINNNLNSVSIELADKSLKTLSLSDFWSSSTFSSSQYSRESYNTTVKFDYNINDIDKIDDFSQEIIDGVGDFSLNLYYSKRQKSKVPIINDFLVKERNRVLETINGVKIYRDGFRLKGYGDSGILYDWLNLASRHEASPAAASHQFGKWRIPSNQLFGYISISRLKNPHLYDNANREGMTNTSYYELFVRLIHFIIGKFEEDRQKPLREYAEWIDLQKRENTDEQLLTFEKIKNEKENGRQNETYTEEQLKNAVYVLGKYREDDIATQQLLMLLSSAGVLAQTFAHEIRNIGTDLGSRGQLLEVSIDNLLQGKDYEGDEDFNPYSRLNRLNATDVLLSEWVSLIMDTVEPDNFVTHTITISEFLEKNCKLWENLLKTKRISIIPPILTDSDDTLQISKADLHLIINNFILNSAYFLENSKNKKEIEFTLLNNLDSVILDMKNSGPLLAEKFKSNPDEIFEARVTTKEKGTGLGLWIARESVRRNSGTIHVINIEKEFTIRIVFPK